MRRGALPQPTLTRRPDGTWLGTFFAMASPCELLARTATEAVARAALERVATETTRIERKFSRYRDDSVVAQIHDARGDWVTLDEESIRLLSFADQVWKLSSGAFDITSGVLRRVWNYRPGSRLPRPEDVEALLPFIGWQRARWEPPCISLPPGMEIDLGGIGKEYAVDRAAECIGDLDGSFLVNLGGDLRAVPGSRPHPTSTGTPEPWVVGIERPGTESVSILELSLEHGALATSGDSKRSIVENGVRYGHILDPRTGWPVPEAPRSVTVHAPNCVEAGMFATLALLHGRGAEGFLQEQGIAFWCHRGSVDT